MNDNLTPFRIGVLLLPQLTLGYFIADSYNLLGGIYRTDAGFAMLMTAIVLIPLLCLGWLIVRNNFV